MRLSCHALAVILFCGVAAAQARQASKEGAADLSKERLLTSWANSLGGRQSLQNLKTIHVRGTISTGSLHGILERWSDLRGKLRTTVDLSGTFRQTIVFDGHKGWVQDTSGTVHALSGDVLRGVVSSAYEASYSFLFPDRIRGEVSVLGVDSIQGAYVLRLQPEDGSPVTVYLDQKTRLPQREETSGAMGRRVVTFSDWHDFNGVKFPGTILQSNGDPSFDSLITTERVEINAESAADTFEEPVNLAEPVRFDNNTHEAAVPAEVYGDHIFVPVRINGGRAVWFFLDSGAALSIVSQEMAAKSGLTFGGAVRAQGTGAGSTSLGMAQGVTLTLPGAEVPPITVAVWNFSTLLPVLGRPWDGILGFDVISRVVVRLDYEHEQVTFIDPATFVASQRATALPVTFLGNLPVVRATIQIPGREPIETNCAIDSGADGLHLTTPFTVANQVPESIPKQIASFAIGAGGGSRMFKGRLAGLQLGPYLLRAPIVGFSPHEELGLLASADIGALVGGEILKRFTITFDLPHHRILVQPNSHFSDPFRTNESGLGLLAEGTDFHHFVVDSVEPGSPAERAGLRKGDVLTEIDGYQASELDLAKIDELFQPRHTVQLTLQREGSILHAVLDIRARI